MLYAQWKKLASVTVSITTPNYQGVSVTQNGTTTTSVTMDKDGTINFTMAIPTGVSAYQWYMNGTQILFETNASYSFKPSSQFPVITAGTYTIAATAVSGGVSYSGNITVIVTNNAMVTVIPYGKTATYKVTSVNQSPTSESEAISFYDKISPYSIAKTEMTYPFWMSVYTWATAHGYAFAHAGVSLSPGSSENYPVGKITSNDVIVWCNAYSEMMGLQPCYYFGSSVIRDSNNATACTSALFDRTKNGYRLPTEGEWQYAASGCEEVAWNMVSGYPFTAWFTPTGTDYYSYANYNAFGPVWEQVAQFQPNCLGLYDMSGNNWEYCFDFYSDTYPAGSSATSPETNYCAPRTDFGAGTDLNRVIRSGSFGCTDLLNLIIGYRRIPFSFSGLPADFSIDPSLGFRVARSIITP